MSNDISTIRQTLGLNEKKVAVYGDAGIKWPNACIACGATGDLQQPNTNRTDLEGAKICPACLAKQNNLDHVTFYGFPLFLIIGTIGLQYFWFSTGTDSLLWSWGMSCIFGFLSAAVLWFIWYRFSLVKTPLPRKIGTWTTPTVYSFSTVEAAKLFKIANGENSVRGVKTKKRKDQLTMKDILVPLVLFAIPFAIAYLFGRYILLGWLGFSLVSEAISAMTACWFGLMVTLGIVWAFSGFPLPSETVNSMTLKTDWFMLGALVVVVLLIVGGPILGGYWLDRLLLANRDGAWQRNVGSVCEETTMSPGPIISPLGKVWIPYALGGPSLRPRDVGLDEAQSVEEIDTVICIESDWMPIQVCQYEGGRTVTRYQSKWEMKVVDLTTRRVGVEKTLFGGNPEACPSSIGSTATDIYGSDPSLLSVKESINEINSPPAPTPTYGPNAVTTSRTPLYNGPGPGPGSGGTQIGVLAPDTPVVVISKATIYPGTFFKVEVPASQNSGWVPRENLKFYIDMDQVPAETVTPLPAPTPTP